MSPLENEKDHSMLMQIILQYYQGKRPSIVQRHTEQRLHNNSAIYHKPERALNSTVKLSEKNQKLEWDINSCQYKNCKGITRKKEILNQLITTRPHQYLKPVSVREAVMNYTNIFSRTTTTCNSTSLPRLGIRTSGASAYRFRGINRHHEQHSYDPLLLLQDFSSRRVQLFSTDNNKQAINNSYTPGGSELFHGM